MTTPNEVLRWRANAELPLLGFVVGSGLSLLLWLGLGSVLWFIIKL